MENKGEQIFNRLSKLQEQTAESGSDYVLPDYLGDVRKILYTECVMGPSGKGKADGGQEYYGTLCYNVLYLDSDGKPSGVSFNSDYELFIRCGEEAESIIGNAKIVNSSIRLTGPRKLSARATVSVGAYMMSEENASITGDAFDGENEPESIGRVINFAEMRDVEPIEREYAERLERLDGKIAEEIEILYSGANVKLNEAAACDGEASVKGEVAVYAVVNDSESPIYLAEKIISIDEKIPFDCADEKTELIPTGSVVSLTTNVNADDEGCEIVCSLVLELGAVAESSGSLEVITDAYLKNYETENVYSELKYTELCDLMHINEDGSCALPRETVCQDTIRDVVLLTALPKVEDVTLDGTDICVVGEMRFNGFGSIVSENGDITYAPLRFIAPIDMHLRLDKPVPEDAIAEIKLESTTASAILDEDVVNVSYKMNGTARITANKRIKRLEECKMLSESTQKRPEGRITVYYPQKGDTLFSIAKKYRTSVAKVAWDNSISVPTLAGEEGGEISEIKKILIF